MGLRSTCRDDLGVVGPSGQWLLDLGDRSLSADPEQGFLPGQDPGPCARGPEEGQGLLQRTAEPAVSLVTGHPQSDRGLLCHRPGGEGGASCVMTENDAL